MASDDSQKRAVSFGFSVKKDQKKLKSAVAEKEEKQPSEKDFVLSLEGKHVKSTKPVEEEKTFVIPLIKENKWRVPKPEDLEHVDENKPATSDKPCDIISSGDQVTDDAVKELLEAAAISQEKYADGGAAKSDVAIPLLLRNKYPGQTNDDDAVDVDFYPDEAAEADYDEVPIEHFGMAMLRGMGWKDGEGVGKKKFQAKPIEAVARPKGMGLGADRSTRLQGKASGKDPEIKEGQEALEMKKGACCQAITGRHKQLYGKIEGLDEDNSRVIVKLTISGQVITLSQFAIKLVGKKEYEKYSKYLNKVKVDKYKEEEESRKDKSKRSRSDDDDRRHKHRSHRGPDVQHKDAESDDMDERNGDGEDGRGGRTADGSNRCKGREGDRGENSKDSRSKRRERPETKRTKSPKRQESQWLYPRLRVRVIDEKYKKGKYYKSKVVIEDVISRNTCVCRDEDGKLLEDLNQRQLETVVPRAEQAFVRIVQGSEKGQFGQILDRNKSKSLASVQLIRDRGTVLSVSYDHLCEYLGDIQEDQDF